MKIFILLLLVSLSVAAKDTVVVRGAIQHDGLLDWTPVMYHSNSYIDLGVDWQHNSEGPKAKGESTFRELRADTRLELTQWPMPGYEKDFGGHGIGRLSIAAAFTWGEITVGDVYGQFGSGLISEPWAEDLHLTVLVKESGMIDYQQDYYETKNGWKEFCHTNAVRAFLTDPKGDEMDVRERRYKEKYTIELDESWVPENCMVVAFITEGFQPVVQVEQAPVIAGTSGGADIEHGGITKR